MPAPFLPSLPHAGFAATIVDNQLDLILLDWLIANTGWSGATKSRLTVTIAPDVVIGSTSRDTPALYWGGAPSGTDLRLIIAPGAVVAGRGSPGGSGYNSVGYYSGGPGGPALKIDQPIRIENHGIIGGGGGEGGLHQLYRGRNWTGTGGDKVRAGAGGGAGYEHDVYPWGNPPPTLYVGGGGKSGGADGGDLGQPGKSVGSANGGAAGAALMGNAHVTWINTGDIRGPIH